MTVIDDTSEIKLVSALYALIEISSGFDQLAKLAIIGDLLFPLNGSIHHNLFKAMEKRARYLRGLNNE